MSNKSQRNVCKIIIFTVNVLAISLIVLGTAGCSQLATDNIGETKQQHNNSVNITVENDNANQQETLKQIKLTDEQLNKLCEFELTNDDRLIISKGKLSCVGITTILGITLAVLLAVLAVVLIVSDLPH